MTTAPPLRTTGRESPALLRETFARASYNEPHLCRMFGVPKLDSVDHPPFKMLASRAAGDGLLDVLCRLFLFGHPVSRDALSAVLGEAELRAFESADLLRTWDEPGPAQGQWYSPVRIVPVAVDGRTPEEMLLVGDRGDRPDGGRFRPFADIVFSGHNPLTRQFVQLLPRRPVGSLLDLCTGTGVAALAMAPFATECTAADIAERSGHFAHFNGWLNDAANLVVVCGDLYEPVRGRRFDCIIAHPPYVPALMQELTYRDGGETGDAIVKGIINGVPDHLADGGTFHLLCLGMDTADLPFEQRVRQWLGPAQREFDVVFALDSRTAPEQIAANLVQRGGGSAEDLDRWRDLFQRLQVQEFVYGAIVGRRFKARGADAAEGGQAGEAREAMTRRVVLTPECSAQSFEWILRWFDWLRVPGLHERVLALTPRLDPRVILEVRHRVEHDAFEPASYALANGGYPFFARLEPDPWVVALVNEMNGTRTVREVFQSAVARGRVAEGFQEHDLVRLVCFLLERNCLANPTGVPI